MTDETERHPDRVPQRLARGRGGPKGQDRTERLDGANADGPRERVKGGRWSSLMWSDPYFAERGLYSLKAAHAKARQSLAR